MSSVPTAADTNRTAVAIEMQAKRAVLFQLVFSTTDYLSYERAFSEDKILTMGLNE